tara:strand:+ start:941 stop:1093 length:153 start_codon:yes stop_codon:yes gene_type:complete
MLSLDIEGKGSMLLKLFLSSGKKIGVMRIQELGIFLNLLLKDITFKLLLI